MTVTIKVAVIFCLRKQIEPVLSCVEASANESGISIIVGTSSYNRVEGLIKITRLGLAFFCTKIIFGLFVSNFNLQ